MRYRAVVGEHEFSIEVRKEADQLLVGLGTDVAPVDFAGPGPYGPFSLVIGGRSYEAFLCPSNGSLDVYLAGRVFTVTIEDERRQRLRALTRGGRREEGRVEVKAPMPGLVLAVHARPGDQVQKGSTLVVLEAMKMENDLLAPRAGVIEAVNVNKGQKVEQGRVLVVIR